MTVSWKSSFNWYITRQTAPVGQYSIMSQMISDLIPVTLVAH